ncbi:DUF5343 domain-containing protein [Paucidesulfovibrio longus]|uniref:DUF5343 domain-containing protein n=1 Tax=Paucidesulfovibrio longus TaxID=889 RepID=UPI0012DC1512|nr:DUF5343 domain-containing protein [Paucidesulfovibrio longus]
MNYPSTQVSNKLNKLLGEKLREVQIPKIVDIKWLKSLGFNGSNDNGLLTILKFLDLISAKNVPTERWAEARRDLGGHLATILREKYSDLFALYPNAHLAERKELGNFFLQETDKGQVTVNRMVANFQALAKLADFNSEHRPNQISDFNPEELASPGQTLATADPSITKPVGTYQAQGLTVNLNIQLTLPESTNAELLEQLFSSMHKHLLPND